MSTSSPVTIPTAFIEALKQALAEAYVIEDPERLDSYAHDTTGGYSQRPLLVVLPGSSEECAHAIRLANQFGVAVVPQSGHTGRVGGAVVRPGRSEFIICLKRLNRIEAIDKAARTMQLEAGVVLENAQQAADEAGLELPFSVGAKGSCMIGGNISTNAGGTAVLAHGNIRQLVLGLEVVLPTGEIWKKLGALKKDNRGYDLKQLFIGAEGTLGIITRATLKLVVKPKGRALALAACPSVQHAHSLFLSLEQRAAGNLVAFEFWLQSGTDILKRHRPGLQWPFSANFPAYVLAEITSPVGQNDADQLLSQGLGDALEQGWASEAVLAQNLEQQRTFWTWREELPLVQRLEGLSLKHDISLPSAGIPAFLEQANRLVLEESPGARVLAFGHMGDGNIHYNILEPESGDADFTDKVETLGDIIYTLVEEMGGSFAAEHGIGQKKAVLLRDRQDPTERKVMLALKQALDPNGLMNPGKLFPEEDG